MSRASVDYTRRSLRLFSANSEMEFLNPEGVEKIRGRGEMPDHTPVQ